MMISDNIKAIEDYKGKIAALEQKVEADRKKELSGLHTQFGFKTREDLIAALQGLGKSVGGARRGRKPGSGAAKKTVKKAGRPAGKRAKKRSKRARVTDEMRAQIVSAVKAGGKGTQIAKDFGISVPTLHNIKKAAGLTKSRK